jgi:hypothetical protein
MDLGSIPRPASLHPRIAYCTTAADACRLIDEMITDACERPLAIDIETASTEGSEEAQSAKGRDRSAHRRREDAQGQDWACRGCRT